MDFKRRINIINKKEKLLPKLLPVVIGQKCKIRNTKENCYYDGYVSEIYDEGIQLISTNGKYFKDFTLTQKEREDIENSSPVKVKFLYKNEQPVICHKNFWGKYIL